MTWSLVDTACAPRYSAIGTGFFENFVSFSPGYDIHWEVALDLLKQKTKTHTLKDEQELGVAVLCNSSNWESAVGWVQVGRIVRLYKTQGNRAKMQGEKEETIKPETGDWHCLIAYLHPDGIVISLMWQKHSDYSEQCPVCGQIWSSNRRTGSIFLSFSLMWYLPYLLSVGFYWTYMFLLLSLPPFSFMILSPLSFPFVYLSIYPPTHNLPF